MTARRREIKGMPSVHTPNMCVRLCAYGVCVCVLDMCVSCVCVLLCVLCMCVCVCCVCVCGVCMCVCVCVCVCVNMPLHRAVLFCFSKPLHLSSGMHSSVLAATHAWPIVHCENGEMRSC